MRILRLHLEPYRNFPSLKLDLDHEACLIVADNGLGKSNVLESISYLSIGKSIRGARDQEVVPHGTGYFDIQSVWDDGCRDRQVRMFYSTAEGKRAFLDGVDLPRLSDLVSLLCTVHFAPEDVSLVLQFASQRRRLLDILLSQACPEYLQGLQRYNRALTQRNHYLRRLAGRRSDPAERRVWGEQLAVPGGAIRRRRLETLVQMTPVFMGCYQTFSTGQEQAGISYRSEPVPMSVEEVPPADLLEQGLMAELEADPFREERAGHTLCGPHRDSLSFTLGGSPADTYGSQGQLKSLLLSWKMAEARFLEERTGSQPVLLLDDVFSELDETRSRRLVSLTEDFQQVILTSARLPGEEVGDRFQRIEIAE